MKYTPPTPEERQQARKLVLKYWPFIENFRDDLQELLFQAKQPGDAGFDSIIKRLVTKIDTFMAMDEAQFLNKEIGDETSHRPRLQRQDAHVVPSKKEKVRRQSGGGHPIFGFDDFGVTGGEGVDDDIPF